MKRGQVSVEHIVLVGLALGLLLPSVYLFYEYSRQSQAVTVSAQIGRIGNEMVRAAESTYALGKNARQTLRVSFPEGVRRVYVMRESEIIISYENDIGRSDAVFYSSVNLTTNYPDGNVSVVHPGITTYRFRSIGRNVSITEVA